MRIAVGQIWQETNTFNPLPTTQGNFEDFGIYRDGEIFERLANTNEVGGFLQAVHKWPEPVDLVGLIRLAAWPSGPITRETFAWMFAQFEAALARAGRVDAVYLALHGAMAAEDHPDCEGELLGATRRYIGHRPPLVASLDLHAHVTPAMVRAADALVLYHTVPHIDVFESGARAARVLRRILFEGARPATAMIGVRAVFPAERANTESVGSTSASLKQALVELENQPHVLTAGLATVQPWLDVPNLSSTVLVTTDADPEQAERSAQAIADRLWQQRSDYLPELVPYAEAVLRARQLEEGLAVLSDPADATTSGAPGDSTWILSELLRYDWPRGALVTLVSPELVADVARLGVGQQFAGPVGGVRDSRFAQPCQLRAVIEQVFDARFVLSGHVGHNLSIDMGPSAVLRQGDVRLIVTSRSGPHFAPELFQAAGIDPFAASVLIAKSPCGFRAAYASRAALVLSAAAPGCAPSDFWKYDYQKAGRPLWPWDEFEQGTTRPLVIGPRAVEAAY